MSLQVGHLQIDAALGQVVDPDLLSILLSEAVMKLAETENGSYLLDHLEIEIPEILSAAQIKEQLPGIIRQSLAGRLAYERDCGRRNG